jgi:hypothetical protein
MSGNVIPSLHYSYVPIMEVHMENCFGMVEDFEQDDFDMLDKSAKQVLVVLSQFEKGLLVKVDLWTQEDRFDA